MRTNRRDLPIFTLRAKNTQQFTLLRSGPFKRSLCNLLPLTGRQFVFRFVCCFALFRKSWFPLSPVLVAQILSRNLSYFSTDSQSVRLGI